MTMPDFWSVLSAPLVELLGWVLLHFVWQGALVAGVLAGVLYALRDHTPTARYAASCAALAGLLVLPVGTGLFLSDPMLGADPTPTVSVVGPEGTADAAVPPSLSAAPATPSGASSLPARAVAWLRPALPWIVLGWAVGVLLLSARLAGGAWRVRRLRRRSAPAPEQWQDRLETLAGQLGLYRIPALRISKHVDTPMVASWWRPVVLVPVGLLSGLPPDQVEALLLHELAHVRRHDVLVGRLQAVVETLLFFHPATWWISGRIRQAREACCDDLTVQAGADRTVYARALAGLAERTLAAPPSAGALAASDGSLLQRIRRVLAPTNAPEKTARRLSAAIAVTLIGGLLLGLAACASQQSATSEGPEETAPPERTEAPRMSTSEAKPEGPTIAVVNDDSARSEVHVWDDEVVKVKSVDDGYVLQYDGERTDTIKVPQPRVLVGPELFGEVSFPPFDPDSLEQALRLRIAPDSLDRALRARFDPDSLERTLRMRIEPDRLERRARRLELRSDSLERVIMGRIDPDSIKRIVMRRFNPDSLKRHTLRLRMRADSLARVFEERFSDDFPSEFARRFSDSTAVVAPEAFGFAEDPDSLRRHFERMRDRWEREAPEQLREQARRLRERAEELENRAEELESPEGPASPKAPDDTTEASGASIQTLKIGEETSISLRDAQYEKWAQQATAQLAYDELLE